MQINAFNQKKPDRDHMMLPHVAGSTLSARDRGSSIRRFRGGKHAQPPFEVLSAPLLPCIPSSYLPQPLLYLPSRSVTRVLIVPPH